MASCNSVSNGVPGSERYHSGWYDGYGPWSKGSIATAAKFTKVAEKAKAACDKVESSSGQEQIWVPGCRGVGCKANGHDNDCAWCVYDMSACESKYGNACHQTERAREAQGINGCGSHAEKTTAMVTEKAKAACDTVESSSGQEQIWVPGCQGVGCKANGHDNDCAWCVYDMSACESKYGNACHQTERAREAQGINGCG